MKALKIFLILSLIIFISNNLFSEEIPADVLDTLMKKFHIKDREMAEKIALYGINFGMKNLLFRRLI